MCGIPGGVHAIPYHPRTSRYFSYGGSRGTGGPRQAWVYGGRSPPLLGVPKGAQPPSPLPEDGFEVGESLDPAVLTARIASRRRIVVQRRRGRRRKRCRRVPPRIRVRVRSSSGTDLRPRRFLFLLLGSIGLRSRIVGGGAAWCRRRRRRVQELGDGNEARGHVFRNGEPGRQRRDDQGHDHGGHHSSFFLHPGEIIRRTALRPPFPSWECKACTYAHGIRFISYLVEDNAMPLDDETSNVRRTREENARCIERFAIPERALVQAATVKP